MAAGDTHIHPTRRGPRSRLIGRVPLTEIGASPHDGRTLTVEAADTTFRVHDGDQLLTEVASSTTKNMARFKVRKPEPSRQGTSDTGPMPA